MFVPFYHDDNANGRAPLAKAKKWRRKKCVRQSKTRCVAKKINHVVAWIEILMWDLSRRLRRWSSRFILFCFFVGNIWHKLFHECEMIYVHWRRTYKHRYSSNRFRFFFSCQPVNMEKKTVEIHGCDCSHWSTRCFTLTLIVTELKYLQPQNVDDNESKEKTENVWLNIKQITLL